MLDKLSSIPGRMARWVGNLSAPVLAAVGLVIVLGVSAGGYYAYQTYDYVQHDNDFCLSCHLMQRPYQLFARSAHQGLGCKACHQPTLIVRSRMALTQIIESPAELNVHAEVPNSRCAHCHIDGDPEKWRLISNSAGHKVHLNSDDPKLQGLQCVQCHSTSLHEFAPIDKTCAQAGCHEDKKIRLGGMSNLTIHCAACHNFVAPVDSTALSTGNILGSNVDAAILPDQDECLSCHAMRAMVRMPKPDPHKGVCAACHNPHTQATPAEAVESCANAGCHERADTVSPMHRGLEPGVLEDCTYCHKPHDFKVQGDRCTDCHQGVVNDSLTVPHPAWDTAVVKDTLSPDTTPPDTVGSGAHLPVSLSSLLGDPDPLLMPMSVGAGVGLWGAKPLEPVRQTQERPRFLHSQHRSVDCRNCHSTTDTHGGLKVVTLNDCRGCHHTAPVSNNCGRCHQPSDAPSRSFREVRSVTFSVGTSDPNRVMTFPHAKHADLQCSTCHTEGLALSAAQVDCDQCHKEHHQPDNDCTACHRKPPVQAHPSARAHVTCSGSGCHQDPPFDNGLPRTRAVCLACHQDMKDHQPGRVCVDCHTLPSPGGAGRESRP